jgi:hypothetical protein
MHCIDKPAHDFFGEDSTQDRLAVDNDVVPYRDPFLLRRKVYPYTFSAMLDFSDRFATHRHHPVASTPLPPDGLSAVNGASMFFPALAAPRLNADEPPVQRAHQRTVAGSEKTGRPMIMQDYMQMARIRVLVRKTRAGSAYRESGTPRRYRLIQCAADHKDATALKAASYPLLREA